MNEFVSIDIYGIKLQIHKEYKDLADELDKKLKKVKNGICSKSIDKDANKLLKYIRNDLLNAYVESEVEDSIMSLCPEDFTNQVLTYILPKSHDKFIKRYVGGIYALD